MSTFGQRLRTAIEVHEAITLTEFSSRTGIPLPNVSHYISGQRKPGLDSLADMIKAIPRANLHWLITGEIK